MGNGGKMNIHNCSENIAIVELSAEPEISEELKTITEIFQDKSDCDVILDFSHVNILASSAITRLLKLRELLAGRERQLILCGVTTATRGIFTVIGLDGVFELVNDKSAALATLQMVG